VNVLVLVASASRRRPYAWWNSRAAGKMPALPKYSAGCSSRFEKRPKTVASAKMSHYPELLLLIVAQGVVVRFQIQGEVEEGSGGAAHLAQGSEEG
jgi:hypothetical protein